MNVSAKIVSEKENKVTVEATIDKESVDRAIKNVYKEISHNYNFQGFRKGHVPRPVIDSAYGREAVLASATNTLVQEADPRVRSELGIISIAAPDFSQLKNPVSESADYTFTVIFTVPPKGELSSYDAVSIEMPPEEVSEAEIDERIKTLLTYQMTPEEAKENKIPKLTDKVAKDLFSFDSVKDLKEAVKKELEQYKQAYFPRLKVDLCTNALCERLKNKELPEAYLEYVFQEVGQTFMQDLARQGQNVDSFLAMRNITMEDLLKDMHEEAAERARKFVTLNAYADHYKMQVSQDDIEEAIAKNVDGTEEEQKDYLKRLVDTGRIPDLMQGIRLEKATEKLIKDAKVKTVKETAKRKGDA